MVKKYLMLEYNSKKPDKSSVFYDMRIIQEGKKDAENPEDRLTKIGGTVAEGGIINKNDRYYSVIVYTKATDRAQGRIKDRKMLGEVDHPDTGIGTLTRAAIRITKLYMDGNFVKYEAVVLETQMGIHLLALLEGGVGVGVSSRGFGSYEWKDMNGRQVQMIGDDFEFRGIDVVLDQSNPAGAVEYYEDVEEDFNMEFKNFAELEKLNPELAKVVESDVKAKLEKEIKEQLEKDNKAKLEAATKAAKEEGAKEVKESEEYKKLTGLVESIKKIVPATLTESESVTIVTKQLEAANTELTGAKTKLSEAESKIKAFEEKEASLKVEKEKETAINEACKDFKYEKLLRPRLEKMLTVEEIKNRVAEEKAFIESLVNGTPAAEGQGEGKKDTGEGKKEEGTKEPANLTEEEKQERDRQKRLAGC